MLDIKNIFTEMKTAFAGHISKLDTANERISELENRSIETCQINGKEKKKNLKDRTGI